MAYLPDINDPSILCDSTVFSSPDDTSEFEFYSSMSNASGLSSTQKLPKQPKEHLEKYPLLPQSCNFSALGSPTQFQHYIAAELPSAFENEPCSSTPSLPKPPAGQSQLRRKEVNSTFLNSLLRKGYRMIGGMKWIEDDVFPDSTLPIPFDRGAVLSCPQLWNSESSTYPCPPANMTEAKVREWLNNIANNLAVVHNIADGVIPRCDCGFDSRTALKGPLGAFMLRRPDISVIDREIQHDATKSQEERLNWNRIHCIVEVTGKQSPLSDLLEQISQKAACIFDAQPQRTCLYALCIFGAPVRLKFTFVLVDRSGLIYSPPTTIDSHDLLIFLRIVFAFCFAKPETIGWDPSMTVDPETCEVTSIAVTGCEGKEPMDNVTTRTFKVVKLVHSSPTLFSRGTRVWIVKDEQGKFCVLKDSWILQSGGRSEIDLIRHIEQTIDQDPDGHLFVHNCPLYVIGQDCVYSTSTIRSLLLQKPIARHRRRIVTMTIGDPITSFRSKKEFVCVFLDIVNTLEFLNTKANIIHGDISVNNILINRVWDYKPGHSPSQLRQLIANNKSLSQPGLGSNAGPVVQPSMPVSFVNSPPVLAPVVQGSAPAPAPAVNTSASIVDYCGTSEHIEFAGMLIDCDFMRYLGDSINQTSGTLPFMAIEALMSTEKPFEHKPGHDLECLLHTMLTICNYTTGPCGELRENLPNSKKLKLSEWFTTDDWRGLAGTKSITLEAFDIFVEPTLPDYWKDFAPFLQHLINVTWSGMTFCKCPNIATHEEYRNILSDALNQYASEEKALPGLYASVPAANRPSDLRNAKRLRQGNDGESSHKRQRPRRPASQFLGSYQESIVPPEMDPTVE